MVELFPARLEQGELHRGRTRIFGPVNWDIGAHGITMVLGPNGAGKTSLLKSIHGLERLSKGRMHWPVPRAQARAAQAFVFQSPVVMRRSVLENVAYPLRLLGVGKPEAKARAEAWLARTGLTEKATHRARTLSGGERQKMAMARALIRAPRLLILDEPCANLDGRAKREIETLLHEARATGTRIIMATHDIGQARRLADDVLFLHHGLVVETGAGDAFFAGPKTTQARAFLNGDILE